MLTGLLGTETILLETPLSEGECARRLQTAVRSRWSVFRSGAIVGRVDAAGFKIRNRSRSSFLLVMRGRFERAGDGARLVCRMRRNPAHFIGAIIFGTAIIAMLIAGIVGTFMRPTPDSLPQVIIPAFFFLAFGFMMVSEFIRSGDDRDILLDFLRRVTESRLVGSQEPAVMARRP